MSKISTMLNSGKNCTCENVHAHTAVKFRSQLLEDIRKTDAPAECSKLDNNEYVEAPPHYHSNCSDEEMKMIINRIYERGYIEAIDVIDAFFKDNFNLASAFKYIARLGKKDDTVTEIEKAIWYLQHERSAILEARHM